VYSNTDSFGEGLIDGEAKVGFELGMSDENESQIVASVLVETGEKPPVIEGAARKQMGFVDDEDGLDLLGARELLDAILDVADEVRTTMPRFDLESVCDLAI